MKFLRAIAAALLIVGATWGASASAQITFKDITRQAGISFVHNNGARGKKYLPETMGPGCAFIDYDNDGNPDILLVNGKDLEPPGRHSTLRLYHNSGNGTFTDVTAKSGLAIEMFGLGVAVGDFDNDGFDDLFITALGQSHLFRNTGKGTFIDVTKSAGLFGPNEFSTSAAWVDYDRDGKLDLIVGNYVQWTQKTDIYCTLDGTKKSYCTPEAYKGASVRLWHNLGNSRFEDATAKSGLFDTTSKSLGIAVSDVNGDGWPDLIIANDTQPNKLYVNDGKGKFTESAVGAGIAFSEDGVARAGMGVDAVDYDRSGKPSIIIGNFSNQMMALYHNEGNALFVDEAPRSEVGRKSLLTLGFACFFFDYDLDGWQDIFVNNGHIENEIEKIQKRVKYAQPAHLFHNDGAGKFSDATPKVGPAFSAPRVGRGAAFADIDNDGDLDLLITTNGGPAVLLRSDGGTNHSLRLKLSGIRSNRDGIGAVVKAKYGADQQTMTVRSGSSYLSASELILTFGVGNKSQVDELVVTWPSGQVDKLTNVPAGQSITIREGSGIANRRAYKPQS
jgi:enediyne biosynthesis protein E4